MRARKNPQPFTLENLLREMKPGRGYSPEVIALVFGVTVDVARGMLLGAVMLGEICESVARRGIRAAFYVPARERQTVASRRVGPLEGTISILTGYTTELWRLHDLCMASRGLPELMRYPSIFWTVQHNATMLEQMGEFQRDRAEHASDEQPQRAAQR